MENDPLYLLLQFPKGASPPVEPEELLQGACPGGGAEDRGGGSASQNQESPGSVHSPNCNSTSSVRPLSTPPVLYLTPLHASGTFHNYPHTPHRRPAPG